MELKGEVLHKGKIIPVEVEIGTNWLGQPGIVVHLPEEYVGESNLTDMITFISDLDEEARV